MKESIIMPQRTSHKRTPFDNSDINLDSSWIELWLPFFNVKVTPMTSAEVRSWVRENTNLPGKRLILNHNLHSLYLLHSAPNAMTLYDRANVILVDGFPVLKLADRVSSKKLTGNHRVGSLDWLPDIGEILNDHRIAIVGGTPLSNSKAVERLSNTRTLSDIQGWSGANWDSNKASLIAAELSAFRPHLVLIGLGMPLQETFIHEYWDQIPDAIYATVGGAIDQLSGVQKPAPRWLGKVGLEWLWRLATQPRRLSKRYLVEPWVLLYLAWKNNKKGQKVY